MTLTELLAHLRTTGQSPIEYALQLSNRDEWQGIDKLEFGVITGGEVMDDSNRMYVNIPTHKGVTCGSKIAYRVLPIDWKPISPPSAKE